MTNNALPELKANPTVAYVIPVLNGAAYIAEAVASVLAQDYEGTQKVAVAVGPSHDGTEEIVQGLAAEDSRVLFVENPAGNTPSGLNRAIESVDADVIIRVDGHSVLSKGYTRIAIETLRQTGAADVGGIMDAQGTNPIQRAVAAAYKSPFGLGNAPYHTGAQAGPADSAYLGVFRREIFDIVGLYDESMIRAQDWELCKRIREAGYAVWFDPQLRVRYYPRDNFGALARQTFASGVWRGELGRRGPGGARIKHYAPPAGLIAFGAGVLGLLIRPFTSKGSKARKATTVAAIAPIGYGIGILGAAWHAGRELPLKEKGLLARVLPTMHGTWAAGFIRGRILGAGDVKDTSRVK